eukprot:CAMPEP_0197733902 /NCGR_PEP_ID=MMETSP1434-20131217/44147_1 /TAXON_ID=265543 /ORGANISM="Minutocellus polymorphus, Strain CCMP3303" /LENGTH=191 /DNA_ID=CAMNT_0043321299 /DNA_START=147 /DNA_END=723 /DNA_ORIENTATION=+
MNDHDMWWEERRARNRAAAQGYQNGGGPPPPPQMMDPYAQGPGGGQPLDQVGLETLLVAFAESDYMAGKFRYYGSRISHTDRGPVFDVFRHASVKGGDVELELRDPFDEGKKVYLDRLAKYIGQDILIRGCKSIISIGMGGMCTNQRRRMRTGCADMGIRGCKFIISIGMGGMCTNQRRRMRTGCADMVRV